MDVNALIGRWPFQRFKYEGVDGVLALMDRAGIDKAVITSLNSVFYYDYEIGNREVGEACKQHPNRFIPFTVINPNFLNWKDHLKECVGKYGVKGIKLHLDHHRYSPIGIGGFIRDELSLLEEETADVMEEAKRLKLPVYIQTSVLDMRHHPGYCLVEETPISEVASAIKKYAENKIIVGGAKHFSGRVQELLNYVLKSENFYIETSGIGGPFDGVGGLVEQIGSSRLLFGTRIPLHCPESAKLMVEQSKISDEDKEKILGGNAAELLSLKREETGSSKV